MAIEQEMFMLADSAKLAEVPVPHTASTPVHHDLGF